MPRPPWQAGKKWQAGKHGRPTRGGSPAKVPAALAPAVPLASAAGALHPARRGRLRGRCRKLGRVQRRQRAFKRPQRRWRPQAAPGLAVARRHAPSCVIARKGQHILSKMRLGAARGDGVSQRRPLRHIQARRAHLIRARPALLRGVRDAPHRRRRAAAVAAPAPAAHLWRGGWRAPSGSFDARGAAHVPVHLRQILVTLAPSLARARYTPGTRRLRGGCAPGRRQVDADRRQIGGRKTADNRRPTKRAGAHTAGMLNARCQCTSSKSDANAQVWTRAARRAPRDACQGRDGLCGKAAWGATRARAWSWQGHVRRIESSLRQPTTHAPRVDGASTRR